MISLNHINVYFTINDFFFKFVKGLLLEENKQMQHSFLFRFPYFKTKRASFLQEQGQCLNGLRLSQQYLGGLRLSQQYLDGLRLAQQYLDDLRLIQYLDGQKLIQQYLDGQKLMV